MRLMQMTLFLILTNNNVRFSIFVVSCNDMFDLMGALNAVVDRDCSKHTISICLTYFKAPTKDGIYTAVNALTTNWSESVPIY